ncbi:MAG: helix-turn-helix transcriptional regulator [Vicinamibacterales bacterium]
MRIADALAALEDPPTHADALIAHQLRERVRAGCPVTAPLRQWAGRHRKVAVALDVIERRHRDPALRLADAAHDAGLSPSHLGRQLVSLTGLGFAEHLRRARISTAETMLTTTPLSIKEVAHAVGYGSSGAFDRAFRQVHGQAPLEWARRHATDGRPGSGVKSQIE